MANRSKNRRRVALYAASTARKRRRPAMHIAQGRLDHGPPVAVIDIGSNSVRLVVYEGLTRSPTPIFNEKVLAGLGREVQSTGLLAADAVDKALAALRRFRALCDRMEVAQLWAIATAACRDADNGKAFVAEAERICRSQDRRPVRQARGGAVRARRGVRFPPARRHRRRSRRRLARTDRGPRPTHQAPASRCRSAGWRCRTCPRSRSRRPRRSSARRSATPVCSKPASGRTFYAIGGTWRALARLHMWQTGYPLHVMHGYVMPAREALRLLPPGASGRSRNALADRGGHRCAPAAARLCGARARTSGAHRASEGHRDLRARRARGPALFDARRRGARQGSADRRRAASSTCCARARPPMARS